MFTGTKRSQEIEIKARLRESLEVLKNRFIQQLGIFPEPIEKTDRYYGGEDFSFRLRGMAGQWVLTFKDKTSEEGIEVNQEWEMLIPSEEVFKLFLTRLQVPFLYEKSKKGWFFLSQSLTIELLKVGELEGVFVEIETLLPADAKEEEILRAKSLLNETLSRLGISPDEIEKRPYREILGF